MPNKKEDSKLGIVVIFAFLSVAALVAWAMLRQKQVEEKPIATETTPQENQEKEIYFASNGKNTVYKIKKGDKWSVIWNGTQGKEYDFVSNPVFSPDGTQLAYNAEINGQAFVVVNNQLEINAYNKAGYLVFSQDGKTIAFVASRNDGTSLIITSSTTGTGTVNGQENQLAGNVVTIQTSGGTQQAIVLSNDGSQIAYAYEQNGQTYLIINGNQTAGYDSVSNFTFNPDGTYSYTAQQNGNTITVVNGTVTSTNPSSDPEAPGDEDSPENSAEEPNRTKPYKYRISTDKDIDLPDDRLDYNGCNPETSQCNF